MGGSNGRGQEIDKIGDCLCVDKYQNILLGGDDDDSGGVECL